MHITPDHARSVLSLLLAHLTVTQAWIDYNVPYNNFAPRFRSGGYNGQYGRNDYRGGDYGGNGFRGDNGEMNGYRGENGEIPGYRGENTEGPEEEYTPRPTFNNQKMGSPFTVPTSCLGSNIMRTLKNLGNVPPGSNATFIPLGQVLIPTGKEMTFCRPNQNNNNNNYGAFQGPSPNNECCPDYSDNCNGDYDNAPCCPCCCRRFFAVHRRRRSVSLQRRFYKLQTLREKMEANKKINKC